MAILTVSRQIASLGDELCKSIAEKLGYRFVSRKDIEKKIIELGFPESKLRKFDEKKPGFFASLSKDRDEYLDYLQLAIYEAAAQDDCVIIGRGSFIILKDVPNHISLRFVSDRALRISRYENEHKCSRKYAEKIINESDQNRLGFHKSFFNFDHNDPAMFHLVINTGLLEESSITDSVASLVKNAVTAEKTSAGKKMMEELVVSQRIVNSLSHKHGLEIKFLRTEIQENKIGLFGIAESIQTAEKAKTVAEAEFPGFEVSSSISVVEDFKS